MLLLVTDTSGKHGSVGLVRADDIGPEHKTRLIESVPLAGGTFSAQLVPQIAALLDKHALKKTDIDAFVVISGPGSFTGLRVGLAAIKALAEILRKPIVPLSLLEVVAIATRTEGNVLAVIDAGRGEVYAGAYEIHGDTARLRKEQLLVKSELPSAAHGCGVSTPDEALAQVARDAGLSVHVVKLGTEEIAQVGLRKMRAGETVSPEHLEANYIRRSGAEILSNPAVGR